MNPSSPKPARRKSWINVVKTFVCEPGDRAIVYQFEMEGVMQFAGAPIEMALGQGDDWVDGEGHKLAGEHLQLVKEHAAKLPPIADVIAEKERLRFEGDLDKWMKKLGAGITGFQPEAYAVMDAACDELVRLREENADMAIALDKREIESGLTRNGNMWRYWSRKAREIVDKFAELRAEIERLRKALQYYADAPGGWSAISQVAKDALEKKL